MQRRWFINEQNSIFELRHSAAHGLYDRILLINFFRHGSFITFNQSDICLAGRGADYFSKLLSF